jgi:hypothetical protein
MTLGNYLTMVVSVGTLVIGIGVTWGITATRIQNLEERVQSSDLQRSAEETRVRAAEAASEARLRAVELSAAGQSSDLRNIQSTLSKIESSLEKLIDERP